MAPASKTNLGLFAYWILLSVLVFGIDGCSGTSSGAPPTVVCGKTLDSTAAGATIYDIAGGSLPPVRSPTVRGLVFLKVSHSCQTGSDLALTPPDTLQIVDVARASDGKYAAVALKPIRLVSTKVVARQNGQMVGEIEIDLKNF